MSIHGIFEIELGTTKVFYVDGATEKVLVDTGMKPLPAEVVDYFVKTGINFSKEQLEFLRKGSRSAIVKFLRKNNYQVDSIICTHCHGDHIGNLAVLKDELNVKVAAHKNDIAIIEGRESLPKPEFVPEHLHQYFNVEPCKVDIVLEDRQQFNEEIEIIHIEGHTRGNICLLVKGIALIAGDTMSGKGALGSNSPKELNPPGKQACMDWDMAVKNIGKLLNYQFDSVLPSHGMSVKRDGKKIVQKLAEEFKI